MNHTAREIEFVAAVRQGLTELDRGDSVAIDEVELERPSELSMTRRDLK
jgi:hypothetical protein